MLYYGEMLSGSPANEYSLVKPSPSVGSPLSAVVEKNAQRSLAPATYVSYSSFDYLNAAYQEQGEFGTARSRAGVCRENLQLLIDLFEENERLNRQVGEMETFLKDHGLVWIGTGDPFTMPNPTTMLGRSVCEVALA